MDKSTITYKTKCETILGDIREDIMSGVYKPGQKLPTENRLGEIYRASRITLNKTLSMLEYEGLISRKTNVGSVVLERREQKAALRLAGLMMISRGHLFGQLHSIMTKAISGNHYYPVFLDIEPGTKAQDIIGHCRDYFESFLESSPAFIAVDGMYDFPFDFLLNTIGDKTNLIFFNRVESDIPFAASFVLSDYEQGGYMAITHLLEVGCGRIAVCGTSHKEPYVCSAKILSGARKALRERHKKLEPDLVFSWDRPNCTEAIAASFRGKRRPDAVFAFSDSQARTIQRELEKSGLVAGQDYKLVGYFNTPWACEFDPTLTSVSINEKGIAQAFGELVASGDFRKQKTIIVEPELIKGETT